MTKSTAEHICYRTDTRLIIGIGWNAEDAKIDARCNQGMDAPQPASEGLWRTAAASDDLIDAVRAGDGAIAWTFDADGLAVLDMSEHTPGPWYARHFEIVSIAKPGTVYVNVVAKAHNFSTSREAEANARLIAAAPELLEALRGMMDIVAESRGVDGYHKNGNVAEWGEFQQVDDARAAIAKAEGRS